MSFFHSDEFKIEDSDTVNLQRDCWPLAAPVHALKRFAGISAGTFASPSRNFLPHSRLEVEPVVGFEPTTDGLQNRCSTTELNWLKNTENKGCNRYLLQQNYELI
jgi:hypothetical protein